MGDSIQVIWTELRRRTMQVAQIPIFPHFNYWQPIHEPSVQPALAPLKRKRQSEETKVEGLPEKKKREHGRSIHDRPKIHRGLTVRE
jgi:hypothetical protein